VRWERYCNFQHISKSGGATLRTDARSDAFGGARAFGRACAGRGRVERGHDHATALKVEAERESGCQHAEENCERERADGARLLARTGAGRLTDDARKTGTWDGRWRLRDGRTADYSYLLNK
jgi:hypothetical protein